MGVAIGNEVDLLPACKGQKVDFFNVSYWKEFQSRVADLDSWGFHAMPVTAVWSLASLAGKKNRPFADNVTRFVRKAHRKYGRRWVWSFNPYQIWDQAAWPKDKKDCKKASAAVVTMDYTKAILEVIRNRIHQVTGMKNDTLWVGEMGWSSPAPQGLEAPQATCPRFFGHGTLSRFYQNFLSWNLSGMNSALGADHVFYFTMRDSSNAGAREGFGLLSDCSSTNCKTGQGLPSPKAEAHAAPFWHIRRWHQGRL